MPLRIEIPDESLDYLTDGAKDEVKASTIEYADGILKEAGRLEASLRTTDNDNPEITRQIIKDAVVYQKSPYTKIKTSKTATILQLVSVLALFISGALCDFGEFKTNTTLLVLFLVSFLVAATTTVLSFFWRDNK
ncbi:hypothetical protein C0132_22245 [Priestia aryabhattai]|uniref:hypothetical protein n=1 Tax=Priestia aryabhattai TaxID=412384 RepID=UPI003747FB85